MGNPNGAGRVFKSALETYALTKSVLASSSDIDPVATGLVKTAMEEPAIEISIDGDGEALLNIEIARDEPEDHGCSVEIRLVDLWRHASRMNRFHRGGPSWFPRLNDSREARPALEVHRMWTAEQPPAYNRDTAALSE